MYHSTWYKLICFDCSKSCFVDAGDTTDITGCDVESVKCPHCGKVFGFEGEEDSEHPDWNPDDGQILLEVNDFLNKFSNGLEEDSWGVIEPQWFSTTDEDEYGLELKRLVRSCFL